MFINDQLLTVVLSIINSHATYYSKHNIVKVTDLELLRIELAISCLYFICKYEDTRVPLVLERGFQTFIRIHDLHKILKASLTSSTKTTPCCNHSKIEDKPKTNVDENHVNENDVVEDVKKLDIIDHEIPCDNYTCKKCEMEQFYNRESVVQRIVDKTSDCIRHLTMCGKEYILNIKPKSLLDLCERYVALNMDEKDNIELLEFADVHQLEKLKLWMISHIVVNGNNMKMEKGFDTNNNNLGGVINDNLISNPSLKHYVQVVYQSHGNELCSSEKFWNVPKEKNQKEC